MKPAAFTKIPGHACALAAGAVLGWWMLPQEGAASGDSATSAAAPVASGGVAEDSVGSARSAARSKNGGASTVAERSKAYRDAWEELLHRGLSVTELEALQTKLLAEWVEVDPEAAVGAALIALGQSGRYASNTGLLSAFTRKIRDQPGIFWPMIKDKRFGLKTAFFQHHWIDVVGGNDPDLLLGYLDEFSAPVKSKAIKSVLDGLKDDPVKTRGVIARLALLPDNPASRAMWKAAGMQISKQGLEAMAKGLTEAKTPAEEAIYLQGLSSFSGWMPKEIGALGEQLESLPEAMAKKAALAVLGETYFPDAIIDVADLLMAQGDWETLSKSVPIRMHQAVSSRNPEAVLAWAADLPERKETEDLYRTTIRSHINEDPAKARGWIEAMPAGWKRDNALTEYVNSSLHTRNDPAAAQWAMEMIEQPGFRETAGGMKAEWEAATKK